MTLFCNFRDKFKFSDFSGLVFDSDFLVGLENSLVTRAWGCVGEGVVKYWKEPPPPLPPLLGRRVCVRGAPFDPGVHGGEF